MIYEIVIIGSERPARINEQLTLIFATKTSAFDAPLSDFIDWVSSKEPNPPLKNGGASQKIEKCWRASFGGIDGEGMESLFVWDAPPENIDNIGDRLIFLWKEWAKERSGDLGEIAYRSRNQGDLRELKTLVDATRQRLSSLSERDVLISKNETETPQRKKRGIRVI